MRADTFTGQVIAVLSRRASAFESDPVEPQTFPGRLWALFSHRRRDSPFDSPALTAVSQVPLTEKSRPQAEDTLRSTGRQRSELSGETTDFGGIRVTLTGPATWLDAARNIDEGGLPRWLRWWRGTVLAAICAFLAFVAQVQVGEQFSPLTSWVVRLGGLVATAVALLLPARQTWVEVRAREDVEEQARVAVTNYQLTLRSVLLPLTDIFDRIISAPNDAGQMEAKAAAKQAVVNSVVQFAGVPRARSCYFDYERNGQEERLTCRAYAGRDVKPQTEFSSANPSHMKIFNLLEGRRTELKENIEPAESQKIFGNEDCKSYILVPVATRAEIFGLLTLDALHTGELKPQHEKEMLLLAQLLGIALAGASRDRLRTLDALDSGELEPQHEKEVLLLAQLVGKSLANK
jgi:hypothetical protein